MFFLFSLVDPDANEEVNAKSDKNCYFKSGAKNNYRLANIEDVKVRF